MSHLVIMVLRTYSVQLSESGQGRKLPSPPIDSETKEQVAKVSLNCVQFPFYVITTFSTFHFEWLA